VSAVYFFLFGANGAMSPFLSLYFRSRGLSGSQSSLLFSLMPVLLFISQPLFGPLTDRSGHRGRMLAWLLAASGLAGLLIAAGGSFWSLLVLVMLWSFVAGPLVPVSDSVALGEMQRTGNPYVRIRLWGSVGFVIVTVLMGRLYDWIDLRWMFVGYFALNLVGALFARRLPPDGISALRAVWPAMKALLQSPAVAGFLLLSALLQSTQAAHSSFFSLHVQHVGGSNGIVGLSWAIAAAAEVPVWLVMHRISDRVGPQRILAIAGLMYSLRWLMNALAPSPGLLMVSQLLQGFTFAFFMPTAVLWIGSLVPDELRTSGQALLVLVNSGIATVAGNLLAGRIIDLAGTVALYQVNAAVALVAGVGFFVLSQYRRWSHG